MPWYVLTGAPGSGKTAILRQLEQDGFAVIEEAATDVIALAHATGEAEPWACRGFADRVVALQRRREQLAAEHRQRTVFIDRSVICTLALSRFLGNPASPLLAAEVDRAVAERRYGEAVFFVRGLGFVTPTAARRISQEDAAAFEKVHEVTYRELGFRLIEVGAAPLRDRADVVKHAAAAMSYGANQASGSSATSPAPADASAPTTSVRR
jgi:predicted ATPase